MDEYGKGTVPETERGAVLFHPSIIEQIRSAIEKNKIYPLIARRRKMEGTVHVRFKINSQGRPEGLRVIQSSDFGLLDRTTLDIVEREAPFPSIDASLEIPVVFHLD